MRALFGKYFANIRAFVKLPASLLRFNVGFIAHETLGYARTFPFDFPEMHLPPDMDLWQLTGQAKFSRTARGVLLEVRARARTQAQCVRCLEPFRLPLYVEFSELFAFTAKTVTDAGLILPENGQINLAPLLREYLWLAVPINPICRADCAGLCPVCGENLNHGACGHSAAEGDPRLAALRALLDTDDTSPTD